MGVKQGVRQGSRSHDSAGEVWRKRNLFGRVIPTPKEEKDNSNLATEQGRLAFVGRVVGSKTLVVVGEKRNIADFAQL